MVTYTAAFCACPLILLLLRPPDLAKSFFCSCEANGCAAGNTIEEAILQGFFELIDQDSVALWWYNRVRRAAVNLASFGDPYFDRLQEFYRSLHREIWALDLALEHGIPCFAAVSRRTDSHTEDIVLGFGSNFNAHIALLRALTEVNQFLPSVSQRDGDGNTIYSSMIKKLFAGGKQLLSRRTATSCSLKISPQKDHRTMRTYPAMISKQM
jgi:thiazole/oxazole-forming peptide maturase SagD family component